MLSLGQVGHCGEKAWPWWPGPGSFSSKYSVGADEDSSQGTEDTNGSQHTHNESSRTQSLTPFLTMEDVYFQLLLEGQIS